MLYFNLIDPIILSDRNKTEAEIEADIRKKFKMQGIILADINIIKKMDKNLERGYSEIIPVYVDKEGKIGEKTENALSRKEFEGLQKYGKILIKQISEEITSGDISIKPYYNRKNKKTPCVFCEYKNICGFNTGLKGNQYRYISCLNKKDIMNNIAKIEGGK